MGTKIKTFIDLSTTGPRVASEVAKSLAAKEIVAVDAPVSGGPSGAEKGTLAVMVSGPKSLTGELTPILGVIGNVFWVGERPGLGQTMKLCNNLLSAAAIAITSEALVMGTKAGLDPAVMLDVINAGSGRNTASGQISFLAACCRGNSISVSRPISSIRTCGFASKRANDLACL